MKPKGVASSFNCAIEGILWAVRTQRHMRYHMLTALALLLIALFFRVNALEFILLVFSAVLVFFAELVNTALEVVVDMVSPGRHNSVASPGTTDGLFGSDDSHWCCHDRCPLFDASF